MLIPANPNSPPAQGLLGLRLGMTASTTFGQAGFEPRDLYEQTKGHINPNWWHHQHRWFHDKPYSQQNRPNWLLLLANHTMAYRINLSLYYTDLTGNSQPIFRLYDPKDNLTKNGYFHVRWSLGMGAYLKLYLATVGKQLKKPRNTSNTLLIRVLFAVKGKSVRFLSNKANGCKSTTDWPCSKNS